MCIDSTNHKVALIIKCNRIAEINTNIEEWICKEIVKGVIIVLLINPFYLIAIFFFFFFCSESNWYKNQLRPNQSEIIIKIYYYF